MQFELITIFPDETAAMARIGVTGRALGAGACSPNTSRAIAPIPPSEPIRLEASIGISTILEFGAVPIALIASVYFCATK